MRRSLVIYLRGRGHEMRGIFVFRQDAGRARPAASRGKTARVQFFQPVAMRMTSLLAAAPPPLLGGAPDLGPALGRIP